MPDDELRFALPVKEAHREAHHHVLVRLDASGTDFPALHKESGQYALVARPGEEEGRPMALANVAGTPTVELLMRVRDDAAEHALLSLDETWRLSEPKFRGFPLESARGSDVLLVAMGSAIAALRPALEAMAAERDAYGAITLIYGAASAEQLCFKERFAAWEAADIIVRPVLSHEEGAWAGERGHVQAHLPESLDARDAAFVCGSWDMENQVKELLEARGLPGERVFFNYR